MDEGTENATAIEDLPPAQRHIIKRPRLTKLLDEADARIVLLVAPAGYGKTTLAREWTQTQPLSVWITLTPHAEDVAQLARAITTAVTPLAPSVLAELEARVGASPLPDEEGTALGEFVAARIRAESPCDAAFVIDDLPHANWTEGPISFMRAFFNDAPARLVVTSRERPPWVTARDLLYGDALELGASVLAMTVDEGRVALGGRGGRELTGLLALAKGWPAVIGLAAVSDAQVTAADGLPDALYDFFAEELFQSLDAKIRQALCALAIAPRLTRVAIQSAIGSNGETVLAAGMGVGFVMTGHDGIPTLHPLIRKFLRLREADEGVDANAIALTVGHALIMNGDYEDAFSLIEERGTVELLIPLLHHGGATALAQGQVASLQRWVRAARRSMVDDPAVHLYEAELRLRRGDHNTAELMAMAASKGFPPGSESAARAYECAGRAAHLLDACDRALDHHGRATATTRDVALQRRALWGQFLAACALRDVEPEPILDEFEQLAASSPDFFIRGAQGRLILAVRRGNLEHAVDEASAALAVLDDARDPVVRSGFMNNLANALVVIGRYSDSLHLAERELAEAERARLAFVKPHGLLNITAAATGLGRFTQAHEALIEAQRAANEDADPFFRMNAVALRTRLLTAQGDAMHGRDLAAQFRNGFGRLPRTSLAAELLASEALAAACDGLRDQAMQLARQACEIDYHIEGRAFAAIARAVVHLDEEGFDDDHAAALARMHEASGVLDAFVVAARGRPDFLKALRIREATSPIAGLIAQRTGDATLARAIGVTLPRPDYANPLSTRENEIISLVAEGLRNKDIAIRLFISDKTVKTHLQNIYEKLGAHNRTEAVQRWRGSQRAATAESSGGSD